MAGGVERGADRADLAVHHPARPDHVDPGLGLRRPPSRRTTARVASLSTVAVGGEHAAVPVVGELVEAQVGHDDGLVADLGDDVADRGVEDAVGIGGARALRVLARRDAEQHDAADAGRTASTAALRSESRVCWTTPGIDAIGTGSRAPSRTNIGSTRWRGATGLGDQPAQARACGAAGAAARRGSP